MTQEVKSGSHRFRAILVIACTALMLATNLFAGGSGFSESAEPGMYFLYPTPFSPAPFTFAIWLPLFIGCVTIAIFQLARASLPTVQEFALPYSAALLANALTPFLKVGWSNVVVCILFACLSLSVRRVLRSKAESRTETWAFRLPLVAFATWSGLAVVVNLCQWLVSMGFVVTPKLAATLVCAAMSLGIVALWRTKSVVISVVMAWAGTGIVAAQPSWNVVSTAVVVTTLCTLIAATQVVNQAARGS